MIANNLNTEADDELQLAVLYQIKDLLGLIQQNINLADNGGQGQTVTVTGGNLFALASKYYQDATMWNVIAQENFSLLKDDNGFINPNIDGTITLIIPPKPASSNGGILSV